MLKRIDNIIFALLWAVVLVTHFTVGLEKLPIAAPGWQRILGGVVAVYFAAGTVWRATRLRKWAYGTPDRMAKQQKHRELMKAAKDELAAIEAAMAPDPDRPATIPAWSLAHSQNTHATSWLGGVPTAHAGFVWPRDEHDKPLMFLAQIDLADIKPEPTTGARPAGLPLAGAMLIFVGRTFGEQHKGNAVRLLTPTNMARARPVPVPADGLPAREIGFWFDEPTFPKCPVDVVPFLDTADMDPLEAQTPHRLFGRAIPEMTAIVDFKGQDSLITIGADPVLKTKTEHENGFSIWCDRDALARGDYTDARTEWHTCV